MKHVYTSSGTIKNPEKPRVGIVGGRSINDDFLDEIMREGIDLNREETLAELEAEGKSEEEIEEEMQSHESGGVYLFGDWKKNAKGRYEIDQSGSHGFSLTFNTENNNICVEWSKTTKKCHHTSPCYVMADGSGPCGDLDTEGTSVVAYTLPDELLKV